MSVLMTATCPQCHTPYSSTEGGAVKEPLDIMTYLNNGESQTVEFKRCGNQPEEDFYQTVCSFANRYGGHIFLGVADDGTVTGIRKDRLLPLERTIANALSNPKLFNSAPA